jgi:hypothetical protein
LIHLDLFNHGDTEARRTAKKSVSSFKFQVSSFRFQVSGFKFQVAKADLMAAFGSLKLEMATFDRREADPPNLKLET